MNNQLRASWIFKSYVEATWDASGHKRSFCNKPHFSKMLVLAGGLVSKVYGCLNAPLMTEVVCKANVEQLTCQRLISYPLPNLCLVSCALPNYSLCAVGYCIFFIQNEIWDKILLSKYWLRTSSLRSLLV